jgi:hypothetical protein
MFLLKTELSGTRKLNYLNMGLRVHQGLSFGRAKVKRQFGFSIKLIKKMYKNFKKGFAEPFRGCTFAAVL